MKCHFVFFISAPTQIHQCHMPTICNSISKYFLASASAEPFCMKAEGRVSGDGTTLRETSHQQRRRYSYGLHVKADWNFHEPEALAKIVFVFKHASQIEVYVV